MAGAFSYELQQLNEFLLDSSQVVLPNFPVDISDFLEELNNTISQNFSSQYSNNSLDQQNIVQESISNNIETINSMTNKSNLEMDSSSVVTDHTMEIRESFTPMERKRKNREGSSNSMSSCPYEDVRGAKNGKRQRKRSVQLLLTKEVKEKKDKRDIEKKEAPTTTDSYVFVRARRGHATDSHSLAERVRRERISERMNVLQSLVPGCETVNGKTQMLDEIINYVQSLQNQVEFLSMRLALLDPMYHAFGMELDAVTIRNGQQYWNHNNSNVTGYSMLDSLTYHEPHSPNSISQGDRKILINGIDDQTQMFINQQHNLFSFH